jgi:hypothetical protein
MMRSQAGWVVGEDGEAWYHQTDGSRHKGRWRLCRTCQIRFPAQISNAGLYCSKRCIDRPGRIPNTRPDLFERWTAAECWLAGLIWADGCLSADGPWFKVSLALVDEQAIALAAEIAGCSYSTYNRRADRRALHSIRIGHRVAVQRLRDRGLTERKSLIAEWPEFPHSSAFMRGAFDGDGSVGWYATDRGQGRRGAELRLHASLCGSVHFLDGVQRHLVAYGISERKILPHGSIHRLQWNHADSLRLRDVLYADGGPCLERKRSIFFQ